MIPNPNAEQEIYALKRRYGLIYGMVAGLAFSITLWGLDGYYLSQANAYFPWTKFIAGALITMTVGGLAGWLVERFEKILLGLFIWFMAAGLFAWLTALVPMAISPAVMGVLEPKLRPFLDYTIYDNLPTLVGVAFAWIVIATFIIAILEIPMVEQSVFSNGIVSRAFPFLMCAVLMLVSGAITDSFQNQPLREPVVNMDRTIQFFINAQGREVDPKVARDLHIASLREVQDSVTNSRRIVVTHYDKMLENVYLLINFDGNWVACSTVFGHPLMCKPASP